jgi:glycerol-3-phosphate cytidylyltransferase-like family protein
MPWDERAEIIQSIAGVQDVIAVDDADGTVCNALKLIKPDIFGNGGDRTDKNTPEKQLCTELGIEMAWSLGGQKIQSSSDLVRDAGLTPGGRDPENPDLKPTKSIILRSKTFDS